MLIACYLYISETLKFSLVKTAIGEILLTALEIVIVIHRQEANILEFLPISQGKQKCNASE